MANGIPLTEEEVAELAKRHIDDAVAIVAEMQLTAEQLKVHTLPHMHDMESEILPIRDLCRDLFKSFQFEEDR